MPLFSVAMRRVRETKRFVVYEAQTAKDPDSGELLSTVYVRKGYIDCPEFVRLTAEIAEGWDA